jgi:hypothetical protein
LVDHVTASSLENSVCELLTLDSNAWEGITEEVASKLVETMTDEVVLEVLFGYGACSLG